MLKVGLSPAKANLSRVTTRRSGVLMGREAKWVFTLKVRGDMSRRNGAIPLLLDGLLW